MFEVGSSDLPRTARRNRRWMGCGASRPVKSAKSAKYGTEITEAKAKVKIRLFFAIVAKV